MEIKPEQIASFWKYPITDIPIEKLSFYIKHNTSPYPNVKQWEPITDPGIAALLTFPVTERNVLDVLGPGEYFFMLKFQKPDGGHGFYGRGTFIKVGISPEIERLKATLAKHETMINILKETVTTLTDQQLSLAKLLEDQPKLTESKANCRLPTVEIKISQSEV